MPDAKTQTPTGLICERRKPTDKGVRVRCHNQGFACVVTGEFGRQYKTLCLPCKAQLTELGWHVTFQIEGDKAAQLPIGE